MGRIGSKRLERSVESIEALVPAHKLQMCDVPPKFQAVHLYVKRNEETREPGTHRGLTLDRLFHRVRGSLSVLGVEMIEDFEVLFKTLAYVRCRDCTVQRPLRSDRPTRILGIARAFGTSGDETDCLFHDSPHSQPVYQASARAFARADLLASPLPSKSASIFRAREAGTRAFKMRFSRPGTTLERFLRRPLRPSDTHCSTLIGFIGMVFGSRPNFSSTAVFVNPAASTVT